MICLVHVKLCTNVRVYFIERFIKKKTLMDTLKTLKITKKLSINLTEIYSNIHFIGEAGIIVC